MVDDVPQHPIQPGTDVSDKIVVHSHGEIQSREPASAVGDRCSRGEPERRARPTSILARDPDVLAPEKGRAVGRRVLQPRPFVGGLAGVLVVYALGNAFTGPPVSFIVAVLGPA